MNTSLFVRGDKGVAQCDGHVALRVDYDIVEPLVRGFAWPLHYLDLGKDEQKRRLAERPQDPLKQRKSSPIDAVAVKRWKAYSEARDTMFMRTHGDRPLAHRPRRRQAPRQVEPDPRHPLPPPLRRQEGQTGPARSEHRLRVLARIHQRLASRQLTRESP